MSQTGTQAVTEARAAKGRKPSVKQLMDVFGLDPATMSPADRRTAISGYDLRHRIEALVAGVTGSKIKHVYRGDGAATAPGLMILPRIPATHLFPMRHVRVLLGYTAHEVDHQLVTDFDLLNALVNDASIPKRRRQQIKEFWNAIEDYRIEKVTKREYPGFHSFIDDTRDFSAERFCERADAGQIPAKALANPYRIGAVALTWIGADLNGYRTRKPAEALSRLDARLLAWLESWRTDLAAVETCVDARDLAIRILDALDELRQQSDDADEEPSEDKDEAKECQSGKSGSGNKNGGAKGNPKEEEATAGKDNEKRNGGQPDESESEEGKASDPTETEAAGDGNEATDDGNEETGDGDTGDGDGDTDDGDGGNEDGDGHQSDQEPPSRPDLDVRDGDEDEDAEAADLEIDELSRVINSIKGNEARDASVTDSDTLARGMRSGADEKLAIENVRSGQEAYSALRQEIGGSASRSAGIMRRMLQAQHRRTWQGGKEEGDLDFGRLVPMTNGAPDVYRQRVDRQGVNTAVHLLLDNSGSMGGHPIAVCQQTAMVLDMAIQGTRTNVEITGFTGTADQPVLYRYRAFGQKGQMASASLGNMTQVRLMGTPVSTPLLEAWRRLQQQREPRRIMIVVSDGGADWNDIEPSRAAHDFIVSQGCKVIGIAIACADAMKQWCDNCVAIESIDDLPVALTTLVLETMK